MEILTRNDKKLAAAPAQIGSRCLNGLTLGLIGGILIGALILAAALAKDHPPSLAEDESLQARIAKVKQSLASSSASGKSSDPGPMWYNWPNWSNWNNWPNWGNWLNW